MAALLVAEEWEHHFPRRKATIRFALNVSELEHRQLTVRDFESIGIKTEDGWRMAFRVEAEDLLDSLLQGNEDVFDKPEQYGVERASVLPQWENYQGGTPLM